MRLRCAYFITCHEVIKNADGSIQELRCTYDPATRGGDSPDGRRVKATMHWVSEAHALRAEVRLYDRLFSVEDPESVSEGKTFLDHLNPASLETLAECRVEPGLAVIELPFRRELSQQHGFFHAGMTSTIADNAGGFAGYTLFPADSSVLTVEFKINLIAPADGERLIATGRVKKPGRNLTVCEFEVDVVKNGKTKTCALGLQTLMCVQGRTDIAMAG